MLADDGSTYGGVLEIDVRLHHIHYYKFLISACDELTTAKNASNNSAQDISWVDDLVVSTICNWL